MSQVNEFNAETGQSLIREYTQEELDQIEIDLSNMSNAEFMPLPENENLISAMVKLQSLGLTTDEAKAIAGL